jgi:translation initiation factor IF-1
LYEVEVGSMRITAHAGGAGKRGAERNFIRLLVGDRVVVELMPRDLTRGRIVKKA